MLASVHPEILGFDWLPPVPIGRRAEATRVHRHLVDAFAGSGPALIGVRGPSGAGTSTVARIGARLFIEEERGRGSAWPLDLSVRVRECRGAWGVATSLLARLD